MTRPLKPIPEFRSEDEEREFWATRGRDSTQYMDWSTASLARFPNIKPSTTTISLRLPLSLLVRIKLEANRMDVPYQALIKVWLAEKAFGPGRMGDVVGRLRPSSSGGARKEPAVKDADEKAGARGPDDE
jgi:predicted DNA binding CopG/RHH family protein